MEDSAKSSEIRTPTSPTEDFTSLEVHLVIRRKKITLHLEVQETTKVFMLKKMIEAVLNVQTEDQQLFLMFVNNCDLEEYKELSDPNAELSEYGLSSLTAMVTHPAVVGLAMRQADGTFEDLEVTPYSNMEWPMPPSEDEAAKCADYNEKYAKILEEFLEKPGPSRRGMRKK